MKPNPTPYYRPTCEGGAFQLRYSWIGWPSSGNFLYQPARLLEEILALWEGDGMRMLEHQWSSDRVQILFSVKPDVSPELLAARAKGRLDHALRKAGVAMPFSRKTSVRAVGENTRRDIEAYIEQQVSAAQFVDPRFAAAMSELTIVDSAVELSQPSETAHGRYWCNLHLVLVVAEHAAAESMEQLRQLRDSFLRIARDKRHAVSHLSVMKDHVHASLRVLPHESPLDVVFAYQNNLAYLLRRPRFFSAGYYVGTFGEYSMQAVRNKFENA